MHVFKRICRSFRCRSVRNYFLLGVCSTVLLYYINFKFSRTWKEAVPHGIWQPNSSLSKALKRSILAQKQPEKWSLGKFSQTHNISTHLHKMLAQIEEKLVKSSEAVERIARIRGQPRVLARDLPLFRKMLEKNGFSVISSSQLEPPVAYNFSSGYFGRRRNYLEPVERSTPQSGSSTALSDTRWKLLLCLAFSDNQCFQQNDVHSFKEYQKASRFPGLRNVLWKRDSFCSTMTMAKQLPALRSEQVSPLCFVLPTQLRQLVNVAQALGYNAKWTVKPISPGIVQQSRTRSGTRIFDLSTEEGATQLKRIGNQKMMAQQLHDSPLTVFGQPVSVRVYVLVTSLVPLRAFVYNEGMVHHRYGPERNFQKISGRTWLLSELWQYISKNYGPHLLQTALTNLYHVLLQMLLIVEAALLSSYTSSTDYDICRHCFQLLGVDLIFNSTLHPVVLEVNGQPTLKESSKAESNKLNKMKSSLIEDMLNLLFPKLWKVGEISEEITNGLLESTADTGILDWSCSISSNLCLSDYDLQYLVKSRMEASNLGGFRQLYPSADAGRHDALVEQLQRHFTEAVAATLWLQNRRHTTSDLHRLLVNLERWYGRAVSEEYYNDADVHSDIFTSWKRVNFSMPRQEQTNSAKDYESFNENRQCSDDPSTMPFLSSISTDPQITLSPAFSPLVMEYHANVTYDVTLIRVYATAQNCQTEARMDDRFGPSRLTNTSLGVGENKLSLMVVDIVHAEPWVINSYTLIIRRLPVTHDEQPFLANTPHQICSLKQECDMQTFSTEPCGLYSDQKHRDATWDSHWKRHIGLPLCNSGDAVGRWLLPCGTCSQRHTCFWKEAIWHPYDCQYGKLFQSDLKKCFHNKKLLFIGDSTNRGMMHYLIERLNGTLSKWDKTHDIRVYDNVNSGNTKVTFSYYPQFWLPTNQRPVFDKALYQLIQRSRPLENNSNTILVVGGVHWLATQHLHMLLRAIRVERLHGIRLVMKTLGAGFHQPVDSVHTLSMDEQQKLILHSRGLAEFARHYNFEVIDTFNITIARYKDFMQGKCACHFHRVVEHDQTEDEDYLQRNRGRPRTGYHVEGAINAIYSEIMLSRLCSDHVAVT